jgi:hypothetical protein
VFVDVAAGVALALWLVDVYLRARWRRQLVDAIDRLAGQDDDRPRDDDHGDAERGEAEH